MKRTDGAFIDDILIAADSIREYTRGVDKDDFLSKRDAMMQDAVIRQIGIVGEAASHLSASFRAKHSTIPWSLIIGMRNIVVHQYRDVKLDVVWEAATEDVPALVKKLNAAILGGDVSEKVVRESVLARGRTRSRTRR
jgi:uncharacterized protein with HEPN domain